MEIKWRAVRVSAQTRKYLNAYKKQWKFHNLNDAIMSLLENQKEGGVR